jgi:hypothetical protein
MNDAKEELEKAGGRPSSSPEFYAGDLDGMGFAN